MKSFGLFTSAVMLALGTCQALADVPQAVQGAWLAEDIRGGGVLDRVQTKIDIGSDGSVSGSGGCNRIAGKADIADRSISFGRMISTRMACPPAVMDQESKFLSALEDVTGWEADAERGKLKLLDKDGNSLIVLAHIERGATLKIQVPDAESVERVSAVYECGPLKVDAEYINAGSASLVTLSLNGEFVIASNVVSGSGARYAGGRYIWWSKGDEATLQDEMDSAKGVVDCKKAD